MRENQVKEKDADKRIKFAGLNENTEIVNPLIPKGMSNLDNFTLKFLKLLSLFVGSTQEFLMSKGEIFTTPKNINTLWDRVLQAPTYARPVTQDCNISCIDLLDSENEYDVSSVVFFNLSSYSDIFHLG